MPKKLQSKKKKILSVEEKIQELASVKESEPVAPPPVMQVVEEVIDEIPQPTTTQEKQEEPVVENQEIEVAPQEEMAEEAAGKPKEETESVVSEFFTPSKQTSSVGYPNISVHKKSIAPVVLWAVGVCVLVVTIGVGIVTVSKGTFPISLARPTPTPSPVPTLIVTPTPVVNKKELEVEILNGSGKAGVANTLKKLLEEKGYTVAGTGNAVNYNYANTEIQVKADKEAFIPILQADLTGSYVIGSTSATLKATLPYNAVIIIGKE